MKFDANLIDSFDSPFEFALYINMYFGGLRMLDFVGQKLVHTFLYEKKKDMTEKMPRVGPVTKSKQHISKI